MQWLGFVLMSGFGVLSVLTVSLAATANPFSAPYSELDQALLAKVKAKIPPSWQVIAVSEGLLNANNTPDMALVLEAETDLSTHYPPFVEWPAVLMRLWQAQTPKVKPRSLMLVLDGESVRFYPRLIPSATMEEEPLAYIALQSQQLEVQLQQQQATPTGEQRLHKMYQLAWQPQGLMLEHYHLHQVNRATGMFKELELDWPTQTRKATSGSMSSPRHKVVKAALQAKKQWNAWSIGNLLTFEPEP